MLTSYTSILYAGLSAEGSTNPLFDDSDLLEATILRSDRQLRRCLRQPKDSQTLDAQTVMYALGLATTTGWVNGCKIMLEADLMANLNEDYKRAEYYTLLGSSASTNRLEMVQFWLSHRADFDIPQLDLIGYAEDMLDGHECRILSEYNKDILRDVAFYLSNLRQEIRLFVEKHEIDCLHHDNDPKYNVQPHLRYTPKEERRVKDEDAKLREILEDLVPKFISQFDDVGGRLGDFVLNVMIPKMREVAGELKEEDEALYAEGRRKLGIVMYEDEDDGYKNDSGEEEEEQDEITGEESDDEY
ncbi:hypothetical protein J4E82_011068 [Alternaria postmessia]|uniref:uncharacterized protein n=1 Tax=Alternaria postmessia TaxID=1187938 RepID=UPI00222405C8|nr:uncharacterized protein J4E82_011068 [Alternaria postmessia]KAI5366833.1 hypothetical protein J4E82_011068 [Alternaria postmessia]